MVAVIRFRADPAGDRFYALKTFRIDGSSVVTPIWLAPAEPRWLGYTAGRSWKIRRIERNPRIELAPCTFDGTPLGEWRPGRVEVLPHSRRGEATRALRRKYGRRFDVFALLLFLGRPRRHGGRAVGLAVTLDGNGADRGRRAPSPRQEGRRDS